MHTNLRKGWTLVETFIVLAIITLLSAIAVPSFLKAKEADKNRAASAKYEKMKLPTYEIEVTEATYDGCQYIVSFAGSSMTHKGNCNNPIHQYSIEKEDGK